LLARYYRLLRSNRNFRLLWFAQVVSELGDWFYTLAVYSLLLELTGYRAQSVGLAVVLQVLPGTFAAPTAGVVNDRIRRKTIMIGADLARFFVVLGMLLVRSPAVAWLVYPLLLLETIGAAFFEPAHTAVIPNIVAEEQILTANALASVTWSFNLAVGASLGGLAAVLLRRDAVFVLNAVSFLASAWFIRRMQFTEPHTAGLPPLRARDLADFGPVIDGLRYIGSDRRLLMTVFVKFGIGMLGANNVLLPILGEAVFPARLAHLGEVRAGMLGMSLLMGARGVGALIGPLVSGPWAGECQSRMRWGIVTGFVAASAGYLALGRAGSVVAAVAAVALAHAGNSSSWVFSTTLLKLYSNDRFRGRVFAAELGFSMLAISASSYFAGVALDAGISPRAFARILGMVMLIPAVVWAAAVAATNRKG
jgi:MFS family permease